MKQSAIWQCHLIKEMIKVFVLFVFAFYFLYILIDYSIHMKTFAKAPFHVMISYYLCHFVKRADLILPFALLLSTTKVLTTLNINNELVAMLASGSSLRSLMRPFMALALFIRYVI